MSKSVHDLKYECLQEGWEVDGETVWVNGEEFPLAPPYAIHLKIYRTSPSTETSYQSMKRAFELLWPQHALTYNYWMERIFREHCNLKTEMFTLAGGGGIGKAVPKDTPVRTPTGWTAIKNLQVGDTISAIDGATQTVLGVFPQGERDIYKLTFSDGSQALADEEHLWTVYSAKQRDNKTGPQTITTKEIQNNIQKNFSLPNYEAFEGHIKDLTIHPYILGVLLGNGSLSEDSVSAYISDAHIVLKIKDLYPTATTKFITMSNCWRVAFPGLRPIVQKTHSHTKYIPKDYLSASKSRRLALLQGLMDTDGYCAKSGTAQYTTVSPQLSEDVLDLARGLGFNCSVRKKSTSYTYLGETKQGKDAYTINIRRTSTTKHIELFNAPHKAVRQKDQIQLAHKRIVSVDYVGKDEAICIKVSNPNSLFFINDYIVTHNTQAAAYVACLFWLALPHKRAVIVTSTELYSLKNRIYGYVLRALKEMSVPLDLFISNSPPPSIRVVPDDFIHGIYGVAAKKGDDDKTIESIKGRHPPDSLLLILDEATDMPIGITSALPNLKKGLAGRFQAIAIGNSKSWQDLHGLWSTPKVGIENIDPNVDFRWETTQANGVCLYFNPYDSPAIHETDPERKAALSKFLITEEKLLKAEQEEGKDSDGFWQFTMGYWRNKTTEKTIVSETFLQDYDPTSVAEFSGKHEPVFVAGLDPAFSVGGDKCILRLAILGHHINGKMILDYRGEHLVFVIKLYANTGKSAELQIATQVIDICKQYRIPLNTLCIDASGAGRGLADVIQLQSGGGLTPTKIYSTNVGNRNQKAFDIVITSPYELWMQGRTFIANKQIHGLDSLAYAQLHNRMIVETDAGKKTLEKKEVYKKRMAARSSALGRSPDEADAAMLCLQAAVMHYGFFPGQMKEIVRYADTDSYKFAMALAAHKQQLMREAKPAFTMKAGYTTGLDQLIKRKFFS